MENNIVDKTINHKCSMCGGCCSFVIPLTKKEVSEVKESYTGMYLKNVLN